MAPTDYRADAFFETTKRLLAQLINEGLVHADIYPSKGGPGYLLSLRSIRSVDKPKVISVTVHVKQEGYLDINANGVLPVVRPEYLEGPTTLEFANRDTIHEADPSRIFGSICSWLNSGSLGATAVEKLAHELHSTALNQEKWFKHHIHQEQLDLNSPAVAWEQCIVHGHPTHPFHRLCYAQPPLHAAPLDDLHDFLVPELSLVSVPRAMLRINGPFENLMSPLLQKLNVRTVPEDRVVVPCFTKQLPSIERAFPEAVPVASIVDGADAQASMRSVVLRPHLGVDYILKMSLGYRITSTVRTMASWVIPEVRFMSGLLEELLPSALWIYREVAGVTGAGSNLEDTRQISCIIRENLESRALANGQALIVAASLYQVPAGTSKTYAEILFRLDTWEKKIAWFRRYIASLCDAVLPPLAMYGIALEAHAQNIVLRVCRQSSELRGFAVRDWGGVRLHKSTMHKLGIQLPAVDRESRAILDDLHRIWRRFHHAFLQNHVASEETRGGWAIVRGELARVLDRSEYAMGPSLLNYLLADVMQMRCFLTDRLEGRPEPVMRHVPNVVLR
ncbi:IucC family-domain-containing protein [Aspergillus egyptiacus]|nr:IucC family-domain-containing protein [Aspergillus egyptiacus]